MVEKVVTTRIELIMASPKDVPAYTRKKKDKLDEQKQCLIIFSHTILVIKLFKYTEEELLATFEA